MGIAGFNYVAPYLINDEPPDYPGYWRYFDRVLGATAIAYLRLIPDPDTGNTTWIADTDQLYALNDCESLIDFSLLTIALENAETATNTGSSDPFRYSYSYSAVESRSGIGVTYTGDQTWLTLTSGAFIPYGSLNFDGTPGQLYPFTASYLGPYIGAAPNISGGSYGAYYGTWPQPPYAVYQTRIIPASLSLPSGHSPSSPPPDVHFDVTVYNENGTTASVTLTVKPFYCGEIIGGGGVGANTNTSIDVDRRGVIAYARANGSLMVSLTGRYQGSNAVAATSPGSGDDYGVCVRWEKYGGDRLYVAGVQSGAIKMWASNDDGVTWGSPVTMIGANGRFPQFVILPTGSFVYAYCKFTAGNPAATPPTSDTYDLKSRAFNMNGTAAFSEVSIASNVTGQSPGLAYSPQTGRLYLTYLTTSGVVTKYSDDDGQTWTTA